MVLGKLPVPGRPTLWMTVGQGPTALTVGTGGGCLDIFTLIHPFSPLSPSLWETARYRLKYYLKGPLNPKQPTNQNSQFLFQRKKTAAERAKDNYQSGGWSTGKKWADDAPKEELAPDDINLMNIGACGAFVHGLEDEFSGELEKLQLGQIDRIFSAE